MSEVPLSTRRIEGVGARTAREIPCWSCGWSCGACRRESVRGEGEIASESERERFGQSERERERARDCQRERGMSTRERERDVKEREREGDSRSFSSSALTYLGPTKLVTPNRSRQSWAH